MQKVLITGGAGFIPSSLAEGLLNTGKYFVVALDNFLTGREEFVSISPNYEFIKADANDYNALEKVMKEYTFDYVFHYAAVVGVLRTTENPQWVMNDIKGLQHIFELAKDTGVKRIFFSSSSEVYGEPVHLPQHEHDTPLNSRLPYAVVKNLGECFCKSYQYAYGLNYTVFRFFNTFGPRQSPDFVITKFLDAALQGKDITIYGDGSQTRTFCYIADNIEFTVKVLQDELYINDVVNVGDDKLVTINQLAETIIKLTGSSSKIINLPPLKEGDMTRRQPDNCKMKKVLNRNLLSLEEGLKMIISEKAKQA